MSDHRTIAEYLSRSHSAYSAMLADVDLQKHLVRATDAIRHAFKQGRRFYIAGNGGSAADAQHFAAELTGCYAVRTDRPLPATALTTDTSFLTAWGNDDSFDNVFARQLRAHAREGDVFFAISTSGNSSNILRGLEQAAHLDMVRIGLLGRNGGEALSLCDIALLAPAGKTSHVQEIHIAAIHAMCECLDR